MHNFIKPLTACLAHRNIKANRTWIVVLEVIEVQATSGGDLQTNALSARACKALDDVFIAGTDTRGSSVVFINAGNGAVAGLLRSRATQKGNIKPTATAETES